MSGKLHKSANEFLGEAYKALTRPAYWLYSSILDASLQFRNNRLGFLWVLLSSILFVLVLGQLYPQLLGVSVLEYSVHLYMGLTIWNFISHSITQASGLSVVHKSFLSSTVSVSLVDMVLRTVAKNFIICVHNLIPFFIFLIFMMPGAIGIAVFAKIFTGLFLIVLFVVSAGLVCTLLASIFPDLSEMLNAIFRIGFLATPIIWMQDKISIIDSSRDGLRYFIDFNPFYHLIELVRAPLFGEQIGHHALVIFSLTGVALVVVTLSYAPLKRRIEGTF
jgi:ABC-2 type transport system permease protein